MPERERYNKGHVRNRLALCIDALRPWDQAIIIRALELAEDTHQRHFRMAPKQELSSPPSFIIHPMRVALILIEELHVFHAEPISAALLHDVVETTQGGLSTFDIEKKFGRNVALMVSCVTRPSPDAGMSKEQQIEVFQERILQSAKYTRVIKLAERLDNMRDLADCADPKFQRSYLECTVGVYLPIAEKTDPILQAALDTICRQVQAVTSAAVAASE
jgi:guanosine-3',5'-bis(diphosphate) 3'-pyrophosphohydrolase